MKNVGLSIIMLALLTTMARAGDAPAPRFLRARNLVLFTLDAVAIGADGYTTQRAFADGWKEVNPVARAFGRSRGASAGLCSLGMATTVWGSWEAHRHGWRRLEWIIPLAVAGVEGAVAAHNAGLGRRRQVVVGTLRW